MRSITSLILLILFTSFGSHKAWSEDGDAIKYAIDLPQFPKGGNGQVFNYFLPAHDGFAANINLQIQPFQGQLEEYDKVTREQLQTLKFEITKSEILDSEIRYWYQGETGGKELRWYSRAIRHQDKVYLATASVLSGHWEEEGKLLVNSVDSFKLP